MAASRQILVCLESRATYGYSRNVMRAMGDFPALDCRTLVTGMHLMPELGNSIQLIEADGFPVSAKVPLAPGDESRGAWARAMGGAMPGFVDAIEQEAPDIVLISGDRSESLMLCLTAAYMGVPVAHVQAGDRSGHIDDAARFAIARFAHIHFASCADSAERLRRMGEQEFRIFDVGAPQLDDIVDRSFAATSIDLDGVAFDLTRPYILLIQHPVMAEREDAAEQMRASVKACLGTGLPVVWIYPNSDLGYTRITQVIDEVQGAPGLVLARNLDRDDFLAVLAGAAALVGNSSSGILEAPSFRVPVVNIGTRQRGRPKAANIVNCGNAEAEIAACLQTALSDPAFEAACATAVNPYGDGGSGARICDILQTIPLDQALLDKQTTY